MERQCGVKVSCLRKQLDNARPTLPDINKYLLLTEFEVRTISYRFLFFFPLIYGPSAKHAGHKWEKRESITYSMDRENEVSKILIISLR